MGSDVLTFNRYFGPYTISREVAIKAILDGYARILPLITERGYTEESIKYIHCVELNDTFQHDDTDGTRMIGVGMYATLQDDRQCRVLLRMRVLRVSNASEGSS